MPKKRAKIKNHSEWVSVCVCELSTLVSEIGQWQGGNMGSGELSEWCCEERARTETLTWTSASLNESYGNISAHVDPRMIKVLLLRINWEAAEWRSWVKNNPGLPHERSWRCAHMCSFPNSQHIFQHLQLLILTHTRQVWCSFHSSRCNPPDR